MSRPDQTVTPLYPDRPQMRLRRVCWLTELLDLDHDRQTYDAISKGHVPAECVVRVGRRIRICEERVMEWLSDQTQGREAL